MGGSDAADFDVGQAPSLAINSVVEGKILRVDDEFVLVDVGYKSEGHIPRNEWDETELKIQPIITALSGGQI